jgi:hypothetical protein
MPVMSHVHKLGLCLTLIALFITGCTDMELIGNPVPSQERVESFVGAPLPASAEDTYFAEGGFQDTIIWLRFDAPPQGVDEFLGTLPIEAPLDPSWNIGGLTPAADEDWWLPNQATQGAGTRYERPERNIFCALYVDQSRTEVWRVYVVCYNT